MAQNITKKPTRDDLQKAATAALTSGDPNQLADAADLFADAAQLGVQPTPGIPAFVVKGTRDWPGSPVTTPSGPAAAQTGHGMSRGGGPRNVDGPMAYEAFIDELRPVFQKHGQNLVIEERRGWIKIISTLNGHKLYIAKSKTTVSRVESTISPDEINGAAAPDRPNGRIASWIPANPMLVTQALEFMATTKQEVAPPERGADDTAAMRDEPPPITGRTNARFSRSYTPPGQRRS